MDRTIASPRTRRLSAAVRWLLGVVIVAQLAHLVIVVGAIATAAMAGGGNSVGHLPIGIPELIGHFVVSSILIAIALLALVRDAQENARLDERSRRRWLVALALWGPVTMPVYWWRYLRP